MKYLVALLFFLACKISFAQIEFKNFIECYIDSVLKRHEDVLNNKYIAYSSQYVLFLYVLKADTIFKYHYRLNIYNDENPELLDICIVEDPISTRLFDFDNYIIGYIDSNSEFYKKWNISVSNGEPTYFSINNDIANNYAKYILRSMHRPVPMHIDLWWYFSYGHLINNTCRSVVNDDNSSLLSNKNLDNRSFIKKKISELKIKRTIRKNQRLWRKMKQFETNYLAD
jgi:hypothetical protein